VKGIGGGEHICKGEGWPRIVKRDVGARPVSGMRQVRSDCEAVGLLLGALFLVALLLTALPGLLLLLAGVLPATLLSGLLLARGLLILLARLVLLAWLVVLIGIIHLGYLVVGFLLHASNYEHLNYNRQMATRMSAIEHKAQRMCRGIKPQSNRPSEPAHGQ
jgi:hypothetical protein